MKYIIILILIVGGCIYGSSSAELGYRSRVDVGEQGTKRTDQAYKPKSLKEIGRKGLSKSNVSRDESERSKKQLDSGGNLWIRLRDSNSDIVYTTFLVTAYTVHDKGMNGRGITASGKKAHHMVTVASRGLKMGTRIYLVELDKIVVVEDRFGVHKASNRLDLFVNDKALAMHIGKRKMKGVVLK